MGVDTALKIYDRRESEIVKTFEELHRGNNRSVNSHLAILDFIPCVRWNATGDLLATSSGDKTAKVSDFKTGKTIYTGDAPDSSKIFCILHLLVHQSIEPLSSVCFI